MKVSKDNILVTFMHNGNLYEAFGESWEADDLLNLKSRSQNVEMVKETIKFLIAKKLSEVYIKDNTLVSINDGYATIISVNIYLVNDQNIRIMIQNIEHMSVKLEF